MISLIKDNAIPVLDDDREDASVIGWATNTVEAARIYNEVRQAQLTSADFRFRREPVTYDEDINARAEAEAVEKMGAWAPIT